MVSPGQRFMTDLLGNSLMTEGALELALDAAFRREVSECERHVSVVASRNLCKYHIVQSCMSNVHVMLLYQLASTSQFS